MSGFVGILNLNGEPVDRQLLRCLTGSMANRGPDAQEIWSDDLVGLGHALLRTTAEAQGERQPCSLDGLVWLAADARIDGRIALQQALVDRGCQGLEAATDAELILNAYRTWREACVEHLLGDFAFAVWDGQRQQLFCARDHFGVKPLYYARVGACLLVSNTLNCIRRHPLVSDRLDELAVADFLLFGHNQDFDTTAFADIRRLPPAHALTCSADGGFRLQRYWILPVEGPIRYRRAGEYIDRFRDLFSTAVQDRLRTNRVGVLMSGGLDSTSVAATTHELLAGRSEPFDLRAYTLVSDGMIPGDQEGYYAGLVGERLGMPVHYSTPNGYRLYGRWDESDLWTPEPLAEPLWALVVDQYRLAAGNSRVLLTGQGGDPALYPSWGYLGDLVMHLHLGTLFRDVQLYAKSHSSLPPLHVRTALQTGRRRRLNGREPLLAYPPWLNEDLGVRLDLRGRWESWLERTQLHGSSPHRARPEAYQNLSASLWPDIFERYYDPGSTLVPIEFRHPYFDVRLVSYLLALPPVPWFVDKHLTRAAMWGILPDEVRLRPKAAARVSLVHLLLRQGDLDPVFLRTLGEAQGLSEYVDLDRLLRMVRSSQNLAPAEYRLISRPLALACWLRRPAYGKCQ